jgi:hypothetical protein
METHRSLLKEVVACIGLDQKWSEDYFPPLVFLDVLHVQVLGLWTVIFELGHYQELLKMDSTRLTELSGISGI